MSSGSRLVPTPAEQRNWSTNVVPRPRWVLVSTGCAMICAVSKPAGHGSWVPLSTEWNDHDIVIAVLSAVVQAADEAAATNAAKTSLFISLSPRVNSKGLLETGRSYRAARC